MSLGYLVSSIFHNFAIASMIAPILMMPFMLFGGFYANLNTIPDWLVWVKWLSPLKYASEAIIRNEYQTLQPGDFDVVTQLQFTFGLWNCIYCLLGIALACRLLAMLALKNLITKF
jgi:ABC-type multidrug transport system permease subunit